MKRLADIPFDKTFGDVPESFSHRVQYALRRTDKEERPVKSKTLRTIILTAVFICLTTVGLAAAVNHTIEYFGRQYGDDFRTRLEQGNTIPGGQSLTVKGMTVTINDAVVIPDKTCYTGVGDEKDFVPEDTYAFYATGFMAPAAEDVVLMARDDCQVTDPAGYVLYHGGMYPAAPEGAPTYADLAREKGLDRVRAVTCIPNGILDENGEVLTQTVGYEVLPGENGTVNFSIEIPGENVIPKQDVYKMSVDVGMVDIDLEGNEIPGTQMWATWTITLIPEATEK